MPPKLAPAAAALTIAFASAALAQDCAAPPTGKIPLSDLGAGSYQGFPGGLYPNGLNYPPLPHWQAGLQHASHVVPRNAAGQPAAGGKIVLLSIGMSNCTMEYSVFRDLANADPETNPQLVIVDGAQGGQAAEDIDDPGANFWGVVAARLQAAGVTPAQVQAVWLKEANKNPTAAFPGHAQVLQSQLATISAILHDKYPNCRLCYLSSRSYAGYATSPLNPEPFAYEQAFAVKWLIEQQIAGDPALNHGAVPGPIEAPWLAFGSYLWADGPIPRGDGLTWQCGDFQSDGTHPSPAGRQKVAELLLDFFKTDATAKTWFLAAPTTVCPGQAQAASYGSATFGGNGPTLLVASDLPTLPTLEPLVAHAFGAPPLAAGAFLFGLAPLADGLVPLFGGSLLVDPLLVLPLATDALGHADLAFGALPDDPALCGAEVFVQYLAQDADSPAGYDITRGLRLRLGS